jgi:catechol 1,2-dioxygenase
MSDGGNERLRLVFGDLREAILDVFVKDQITPMELWEAIGWFQRVADAGELEQLLVLLFVQEALNVTFGASYAHPEKDGATPYDMEGPAHIVGAPILQSPCALPMRADEQGEPLVVSGVVRSTTGAALPGAIIDVWQNDADKVYSGLTSEDFGVFDMVNDSTAIPPFNLRARVVSDDEGRYVYRTITPNIEPLLNKDEGPLADLTKALGVKGDRAKHIHAIVTADGYHTLTTQMYFDTDPTRNAVMEGAPHPALVKTPELHDDVAEYQARGLTVPSRTVTMDYVLRPVTSAT